MGPLIYRCQIGTQNNIPAHCRKRMVIFAFGRYLSRLWGCKWYSPPEYFRTLPNLRDSAPGTRCPLAPAMNSSSGTLCLSQHSRTWRAVPLGSAETHQFTRCALIGSCEFGCRTLPRKPTASLSRTSSLRGNKISHYKSI